jgi:hypothetical protein
MSDVSAKETWEHPGGGLIYILTYDPQGKLRSTPVRSGKQITLSIEERKINQDRAASEKSDVFTNGSLIPVRLVETAEDYVEIANNPNLIDEADMIALFKLKGKAFTSRIAEISNEAALSRILQIAENSDSDDSPVKVSMPQFKAIQKRIAEVKGTVNYTEVTQSAGTTNVAPKVNTGPSIDRTVNVPAPQVETRIAAFAQDPELQDM